VLRVLQYVEVQFGEIIVSLYKSSLFGTNLGASYSVLQCVAVCCSVLQCVVVYCSVLQCVEVCCSVLQCVAVRGGNIIVSLSTSSLFSKSGLSNPYFSDSCSVLQ